MRLCGEVKNEIMAKKLKQASIKYRKKPVIIDAIQWNGTNDLDIINFATPAARFFYDFSSQTILIISTLEGEMVASVGDYIIRGVDGEFYPCKPEIFERTYEKV